MCALHYNKDELNEALTHMKKVKIFAEALDDKHILMYNHNLSNIYLNLGELDLAQNVLLNVFKSFKNSQNATYLYTISAQNVAYIYFVKENYKMALEFYNKALELSKKNSTKK